MRSDWCPGVFLFRFIMLKKLHLCLWTQECLRRFTTLDKVATLSKVFKSYKP
jgi:hypothetical protein